jgi:hypothetical protein
MGDERFEINLALRDEGDGEGVVAGLVEIVLDEAARRCIEKYSLPHNGKSLCT